MSKIVSSIGCDFENDMFNDEHYSPPVIERTVEDEVEAKPPEDKNGWVFYALYLLGAGILLPWFFFITCNDYWMYRFRDLQNNNPHQFHLIVANNQSGSNHTRLQAEFISYISIASTVPSTLFLFVNIIYLRRFSVEWRVVLSYAIILLCFLETTVLVLFDSDAWQAEFFIITIVTAVLICLATAMLQAALSGIIMRFPVSYITAFSSGQSFAGILAAVAVLLTLLVDSSPTKGTFVYFIFADLTIAASFFGFFALQQSDYYKYYTGQTNPSSGGGSIQYQRIGLDTNAASLPCSYTAVQKKIFSPSINIFFIYLVSGMLYPPIAVLICSVNTGRQSPWSDKYFVPVITYLSYCVSDYVGRVCAGLFQRPKGHLSTWFSVMRLVFIPLLMFCNAQPRHHLPVLIDSDWIYFVIIITFAFSGGFISTLAFILLPERVFVHEQEVASTMLAIWYGISVSIGSVLSVPLINLL